MNALNRPRFVRNIPDIDETLGLARRPRSVASSRGSTTRVLEKGSETMLKRRTAAGIAVLAASAGMSLGALAAIPAHAADLYPPVTTTTDPAVTTTTDPGATTTTIGTEVLGETATNSGLPVTGGDVLGLVAIGGAAALGGTALVRFSRKGREA